MCVSVSDVLISHRLRFSVQVFRARAELAKVKAQQRHFQHKLEAKKQVIAAQLVKEDAVHARQLAEQQASTQYMLSC